MGLLDARHRDESGIHRRKARHFEFVDPRWEVDGTDVHRLRNIFCNDVHDEFAGIPDVARRVLGGRLLARPSPTLMATIAGSRLK